MALGGLQGFISGLVGATGPIGMPTLIHRYGGMGDYNRIVITNSGMNLVSHIARAGAFLLWGYAYGAVWGNYCRYGDNNHWRDFCRYQNPQQNHQQRSDDMDT